MPSTFFKLVRASVSAAFSCTIAARASGTRPAGPKACASALAARPSTRASNALVRSSAVTSFFASASLPSSMPSAPRGPFSFSVRSRTLPRLVESDESSALSAFRLLTSSRMSATRRGISAVASPTKTLRTAPSASGGSERIPLYALSAVLPNRPRVSVNTLDSRSQRASSRGTSMMMRATPSSVSSMRRTRPIGNPENVRFMPTATPSESSTISTSCCDSSNAPRA